MKYILRSATQNDAGSIRALIYQVKINPMSLDWRRFAVAVESNGMIVGCGQVKQHGDGSRELASIAVVEQFRQQGIATTIIDHLVKITPPPLYLTCKENLGVFYEKFGFARIQPEKMPPYFRRINGIASLISKLSRSDQVLLVMMYSKMPG